MTFDLGQPLILEALLHAGLPTLMDNNAGSPLLHELAKHRGADAHGPAKTQMAELLVQQGLSLDALDGYHKTPLEHALEVLNATNAKALLNATPGPNLGGDERTGRWVFMALGNHLVSHQGIFFVQTVEAVLPYLDAFWRAHPEQRDGLAGALHAFSERLRTRLDEGALADVAGGSVAIAVREGWEEAVALLNAQTLTWHIQQTYPTPKVPRRARVTDCNRSPPISYAARFIGWYTGGLPC